MSRRQIYIRAGRESAWARAEADAIATGVSLSQIVCDLVARAYPEPTEKKGANRGKV